MRTSERKYERTHPWINFRCDMTRFGHQIWMLLGEARSKCEHIAGIPLEPTVVAELHQVYMIKGVLASSAIEGNTLSEEQARQYLEGELELPPSQQYLGQEVQNVLDATNLIGQLILNSEATDLTVEDVKEYNRIVLSDLELGEGVEPGEIRDYPVTVSRYVGAPPEDCEHLLERTCEWLNSPELCPASEDRVIYGLLRAILAHLYLAWIHPFGDGNGRTARLIEFQTLVAAGLPSPAAHLLSNHYNLTRHEYYRQLDYSSRSGGDINPFIEYALRGFVDGLKDQLKWIRAQQLTIYWRDYIHKVFKDQESDVDRRRRHLALDLPVEPTPLAKIREVSVRVARDYANKSNKTLRRDLGILEDMDLVEIADGAARANMNLILAFLPPRRTL
jgi:Fic family protein